MKPKKAKAIPGGLLARVRAETSMKWKRNTAPSWVGDGRKAMRLYARCLGIDVVDAEARVWGQHRRLEQINAGKPINMEGIRMSAFFCHDATVDDVVWAIRQLGEPSDISDTKLGQALLAMNKRALGERYEDRAAGYWPEMDESIASYEARPATTNLAQAYKSTCCFHYQCSEGDVPKEPLFGYVDRAEKLLSARLGVTDPEKSALDLPAVERAQWGRDTRMPINGHKVKAIVQPRDGEGNPIVGKAKPIFWQAIILEQPEVDCTDCMGTGETFPCTKCLTCGGRGQTATNLGAMFSSHSGARSDVVERLLQRYGDALEVEG